MLPNAVINSDVAVGDDVTVYYGAIVKHDSVIGDPVHLSPGVRIAGGVSITAETFVGISASTIQEVRIGAGAAVIRDVPERSLAVGVPARGLAVSRSEQ